MHQVVHVASAMAPNPLLPGAFRPVAVFVVCTCGESWERTKPDEPDPLEAFRAHRNEQVVLDLRERAQGVERHGSHR